MLAVLAVVVSLLLFVSMYVYVVFTHERQIKNGGCSPGFYRGGKQHHF
jgi:uncharacterized membrane protein YjfL (UPF0719 family)